MFGQWGKAMTSRRNAICAVIVATLAIGLALVLLAPVILAALVYFGGP
jgi:hypothetical protein